MKIEKNIPIPSRKKYEVSEMQIGDSFVAKTRQDANAAAFAMRQAGFSVCTRSENGGVRVWRIEAKAKK